MRERDSSVNVGMAQQNGVGMVPQQTGGVGDILSRLTSSLVGNAQAPQQMVGYPQMGAYPQQMYQQPGAMAGFPAQAMGAYQQMGGYPQQIAGYQLPQNGVYPQQQNGGYQQQQSGGGGYNPMLPGQVNNDISSLLASMNKQR
jgi:hypothetical protein